MSRLIKALFITLVILLFFFFLFSGKKIKENSPVGSSEKITPHVKVEENLYVCSLEEMISQNIIENPKVNWTSGWQKVEIEKNNLKKEVMYQSLVGGSEFSFEFLGSKTIDFSLETASQQPNTGLEIWLDERYIQFGGADLNLGKVLSVSDDNGKKIHELRVRMYCSTDTLELCDLRIKKILLDRQAKLIKQENKKRKILAILGDSISFNYGYQNYSFLLSKTINYQLLNDSYIGSTMSFWSGVIRTDTGISLFHPDVLIIFLGTNDLKNGIDKKNFQSNYETVISTLRKRLPKTLVITVGLLPRVDFTKSQIIEYSLIIKETAEKNNLVYIDPYEWLSEKDIADGIHPSLNAQPKIAQKFYDFLTEKKLL